MGANHLFQKNAESGFFTIARFAHSVLLGSMHSISWEKNVSDNQSVFWSQLHDTYLVFTTPEK